MFHKIWLNGARIPHNNINPVLHMLPDASAWWNKRAEESPLSETDTYTNR